MSTPFDEQPAPPPPPPSRAGLPIPASTPGAGSEGDATAEDRGPDASFNVPVRTCPNCGAPVHGPYCYACGQSEKGMVRNLSEVFSDLADIVFNVDSRIFRSLFDLYFRPGYLTTEYIDGRRARYVTPFRLFFALSVVAFFAMQSAIDDGIFVGIDRIVAASTQIDNAETAAEVDQQVRAGLASLRESLAAAKLDPETRKQLDEGINQINEVGRDRKIELVRKRLDAAASDADVDATVAEGLALLDEGVVEGLSAKEKAQLDKRRQRLRDAGDARKRVLAGAVAEVTPEKPPYSCGKRELSLLSINDKPWNRESNPASIAWLPDAANARLNDTLQHMCENIDGWSDTPARGFRAVFSVLPQTLFFLMPWFALLLKGFYLFKRRLYMEHLLVALHSHAFLLLSIVVILMLGLLKSWAEGVPAVTGPLGWLQLLAWLWMFVYLFWMQKRVYRQGWIMTILKYWMIGFCYTILLTFGAVIAVTVSLAVT